MDMPKTYLSIAQKAKSNQNELYRLFANEKAEKKVKWSFIAEELGETKQTFRYRFENRLLAGWELLAIIEILKIEADKLKNIIA
jgi:hypothetical protein